MTRWFRQVTVAGVAAVSLVLFSGTQLAAAAPPDSATPPAAPAPSAGQAAGPATQTPSPEPSTQESPAPAAPAPESAAPEAPASESAAPQAPASESAAPEAPASESAAPQAPAPESPAAEAPGAEAPAAADPTPSAAPEVGDDAADDPEPSETPEAETTERPSVDDANFVLGVGGTQSCVPLGEEAVNRTFGLTNTGDDPATATITVSGPVNFSLGTHTVAAGGDAGQIGERELPVGRYVVTFAFEGGASDTASFDVEACESPITIVGVTSACATVSGGSLAVTVANAQDTDVALRVRIAGTDRVVAITLPANDQAVAELVDLPVGDHTIEVVGSIDGREVVAASARATVEDCLSIVSAQATVCGTATADGWVSAVVGNKGNTDVSVQISTGGALLATMLAPAGAEQQISLTDLPAGPHTLEFVAIQEGQTRTIGTREVTVEPCAVFAPSVEIETFDCFSGYVTFDNSESTVTVSFEFRDETGRITDVELLAGEVEEGEFTFRGRELKATARSGDERADLASVDLTERCAALAKPIETSSQCQQVTFHSPAGNDAVTVVYGNIDEPEAEGSFELTGGSSTTIRTSSQSIDWVAFRDPDADLLLQFDLDLVVDRHCGGGSPTVPGHSAPPAEHDHLAATGSPMSPASLVFGTGLLLAGALLLRRRR